MSITNSEFKHLLNLKKQFEDDESILIGPAPLKWSRNLLSINSRDMFILDYYRGTIELKKFSINKRYRTSIVLVRFCSEGMHTNPPGIGGETFTGPHAHLYHEDYADKVAYPIKELGVNLNFTIDEAMDKFLKYCNIVNYPPIQIATT